MKRIALVMGLLLVVVLGALAAGCGSGESTPPPNGTDSGGTGKAQALVFTTPT